MTKDSQKSALLDLGIQIIGRPDGGVTATYGQVTCCKCKRRHEFRIGHSGDSPEHIVRKFGAAGFSRLKYQWYCQSCKAEVKTPDSVATPAPVVSTASAALAAARAYQMISENFANGRYAAGLSDQTISEKTGLSVEGVRAIRENEFGPIAADPELVAMRGELDILKKMVEELTARVVARLEKT